MMRRTDRLIYAARVESHTHRNGKNMSDTMRNSVDSEFTEIRQPPRLLFNIAPAVMIVDDDDLVRQHLKEIVTAAGYSARTAPTGIEALHSLKRSFASIVVTDRNMAAMNGLELCRRIRGSAWPGYVYVIVLTVLDHERDIHAGLDAGADDYISKRTPVAQFTARLRAARRFLSLEFSANSIIEKNRRLAPADALTGAYSRSYFMRNLALELKRPLHLGGQLCLLLLNLEHFDVLNSTHGHVIGNILLKRLMSQMLICLGGATDWCAHLGGEEFAIVLENTTLAEARLRVGRLRHALAGGSLDTSEGTVHINVTVGLGAAEQIIDKGAPRVESLLKLAGANLYANKAGRRSRAASSENAQTPLQLVFPVKPRR
jgi:diguanylate cyclase (GGDEF)-like protein